MSLPEDAQLLPKSLRCWLIAGQAIGMVFGVVFALLTIAVMNFDLNWQLIMTYNRIVLGGVVIGVVVGSMCGRGCYMKNPRDSSLCTTIGVLLGFFPAISIFVTAGPMLLGMARPYTLAGIVFIPIMGGFLLGGFFDRMMDKILFRKAS